VWLARQRGCDAFGVDFNVEQLEAGRRHLGLGERLLAGTASDLESEFGRTAPFDLVTLFEVIEHVEDPAALVHQVARLLRPGGLIAVSCPNESRWMPTGRIFVDYPPHHLTRWRPDTLCRFLGRYGLDTVAVEIDASLRDLLWVAYVNRSAATRVGRASEAGAAAPSQSGEPWRRRLKVSVFEMARWACAPVDVVFRVAKIATMGMRITARKRLAAEN
jgi:SAM-dependent methyltransferase